MYRLPDNAKMIPARRDFGPARPLWQVVPTRAADGRMLADFMMLIPSLRNGSDAVRALVARRVREVCAAYDGQVAFADINYSISVLWVSVDAEPGLAGRVAQSIRGRLPDALLIGGQLGAVPVPAVVPRSRGGLWTGLCRLTRRT